jgi:nucleoside-diphosphate-sugar epimerase
MTAERPRLGVTGASGFVGSRIVDRLKRQGTAVVQLGRQPAAGERRFDLREAVSPRLLAGVDVLVHCAYDFRPHRWEDVRRVNVDGSLRLFAAARAAGVQRIIFLSSISAFDGCRSLYGRAKLMVEEEARRTGGIVIRPGLVFDDGPPGGMVGAIGKLIAATPVVPLIGGGRQVFYLCHGEDLTRLIHTLATTSSPFDAPITAAHTEGRPFRDILLALARRARRRVVFIPVPAAPTLAALRLLERAGVSSRLRSDSLISLMNQNPMVDFAPLARLGLSFRSFPGVPA